MPIYEYECPRGHVTEFLKRAQEEEPQFCEHMTTDTVTARTGDPRTVTHQCLLPLKKKVSVSSFTMPPNY